MSMRWETGMIGRAMRRVFGGRSGVRRELPALPLAALLLAAVAMAAPPAAAVTPTFELRPSGIVNALPPLPPASTFPVQLVLDDDQQEAAFGVAGGGGALQFLWFNQFAAPATPFTLEEIWVLFPGGANMAVGQSVQLVVYEDPDGDPTNGADLLASFDVTIQAVDDVTFSIYPLPAPVALSGGGDVLIGVVNRFVVSGVTSPTGPASLDTTAPQGRSWFAVWSGDPPDPPTLPPDQLLVRIDDFLPDAAGNWMIRGFGTGPAVLEIPTLDNIGLAVMALLLALAGVPLLRRRWVEGRTENGRGKTS